MELVKNSYTKLLSDLEASLDQVKKLQAKIEKLEKQKLELEALVPSLNIKQKTPPKTKIKEPKE